MLARFSRFRLLRFLITLFLSGLMLCLWLGNIPSTATNQSANVSQLVQQGVTSYQTGNYQQAIVHWQTALQSDSSNLNDRAIILENLARAYQQISKTDRAIALWKQTIDDYLQLGDRQQAGRMMTEQAQAYNRIGQHREAIALLCGDFERNCAPNSAVAIAESDGDILGKAAAMGSLGETYRLRGNYQQAIVYLEKSEQFAKSINNPQLNISALNSLGNTHSSLARISYRRADSATARGDSQKSEEFREQAIQEDKRALNYFQNGIRLAIAQQDRFGQLKFILNSLPIYYRTGKIEQGIQERQKAVEILEKLPEKQDKVYAAIDLARLLQPDSTSSDRCLKPELQSQAIKLLDTALTTAQNIQDSRAQSFALGELGYIYECRQEYKQALDFTQKARWTAEQNLQAQDSLYLWEWQTGRIYQQQKRQREAIAAYERSIATLETIRDDLLTANRDIQFDFRDRVEPIYRELIELKLGNVPNSVLLAATDAQTNRNLSSVLTTVDSLRLAELQNYFGNDCALEIVTQEDLIGTDSATVVFNSIILPNRTAIVVSFPNGSKKVAWIDRDREKLAQEMIEFRRGLGRWFDDRYDTQKAQHIYDWVIRPFAEDLRKAKIDTLVFIQDGIFRTIPMAALHDGKQFLIEQYAIATTPSLALTNLQPLKQEKPKALVAGLTEGINVDRTEYPPLPKVSEEIEKIKRQFSGSKQLVDREFTRDRLQQELSKTDYPIIHIATHGEFGEAPEDTFLITGDGQKLTIKELEQIIRNTSKDAKQVELLSLTACKTALGDERAALGLAGIAVQAGAKSSLASLWSIDDTVIPQVVEQFYAGIAQAKVSKAKALQQAQIKLIQQGKRYAHPAYWAAFTLIGNWL
jgi:CHAT domain-containing protein